MHDGNHLEVFGYEGWPDQQNNPWDDIPDFSEEEYGRVRKMSDYEAESYLEYLKEKQ